jgi:hypothetical protein
MTNEQVVCCVYDYLIQQQYHVFAAKVHCIIVLKIGIGSPSMLLLAVLSGKH